MAAPAAVEQILLRAHPSRLYSFGLYSGAGFLFLVAMGLLVNSFVHVFALPGTRLGPLSLEHWATVALVALAALLLLAAEVRRVATTFTITDSRVTKKAGIVNTTMDAVPYRQVERVELSQSLLQRIARVGTVTVDTGEDVLLIEHVSKPDNFERLISQRIAMYR